MADFFDRGEGVFCARGLGDHVIDAWTGNIYHFGSNGCPFWERLEKEVGEQSASENIFNFQVSIRSDSGVMLEENFRKLQESSRSGREMRQENFQENFSEAFLKHGSTLMSPLLFAFWSNFDAR